jgi:hypothetical protein
MVVVCQLSNVWPDRKNLNTLEGPRQILHAEGLYSKESGLLERQEIARPELDRLRMNGCPLPHPAGCCNACGKTKAVR